MEMLELALEEQRGSFGGRLPSLGGDEMSLDQNFSVCEGLAAGLPRAAKRVRCGVAGP